MTNVLAPSHKNDEPRRASLAFRVKLLLIDGHYYVYRSFFALPALNNSRGQPTNAILGFTKTVRRMLKDLQPEMGAVFWDEGLPQKRVELQPAYKETRKEMPLPMVPAAASHSRAAHRLDGVQKHLPAEHGGRRPDGLLRHRRATRWSRSDPRHERQGPLPAREREGESLHDRESGSRLRRRTHTRCSARRK